MRPIDADALRLMKAEECEGHTIDYAAGWKACIDWIKTLPTLDAVPVVRCKDCVYFKSEKLQRVNSSVFFTCPANGGLFGPDDYCTDGERRAEDD